MVSSDHFPGPPAHRSGQSPALLIHNVGLLESPPAWAWGKLFPNHGSDFLHQVTGLATWSNTLTSVPSVPTTLTSACLPLSI